METKTTTQKALGDHAQHEYQKKIGDLLKFFCNNVFLGQLELAKTAIPSLMKELDSKEHSVNFADLLISISEYPFSQSLGSPTIPSPHHLSWFCLNELKQIFPDPDLKKKKIIDTLTKDVDFRLTLSQLKNTEDVVIQELYVFFKRHVLKLKTPTLDDEFEQNAFLSKATISSLKATLLASPSLGNSVVRALMSEEESKESRNNEMLQGIYIECMNSLIDQIKESEEADAGKKDNENLIDRTLEILSFYDPVPYWNYLHLRQLFTRLLTLTTDEKVSSLSVERIASVICGRHTPYLLDEFCKIFQEVSMLTILKSVEEQNNPLTEDERISLRLLKRVDRNSCWRDFFILCLKKRVHFLADILSLSLSLVRSGNFIDLQDLLSFPELQPLKPSVMLMGWSHCVTSAHARTLLDTLWDDSMECHNLVLTNSCRKLAYHLDLIQWCLDRAKPLLEGSESSPIRQATELLQGLETYSVLYMLHHSTSLASLDHSEVLQLLTNVSTDKKKDSKRKTVTFQDEATPVETSSERINIEQQKDIAIFRGFCAVKNVMDAIAFCGDNFEHELMNPVQIKKTVRTKSLHKSFLTEHTVSSSEGEDSSSQLLNGQNNSFDINRSTDNEDSEKFIKLYEQMVSIKLRETREHLLHLQPLTLRLELLENIFSLIFVTHQDQSDATSATDAESDDGNDDSKQSSLELVANDSLNMSVVSEEDDSVVEKSKSDERPSSSSNMSSATVQATASGDVGYDEPFVDPYQKKRVSSPGVEAVQSSYFSLNPELQEKADEVAKQKSQQPKKIKRRRKRTLSEQSTNSVVGFLCNEYLVRDILHMLKDAISDLNNAKFTLSGKVSQVSKKDTLHSSKSSHTVDPVLESALQTNILTSIQPGMLPKRTTKFTQAVHEAWWRFQLVAHEAIPRQPGRILPEKVLIMDNDINFLPVCEGKVFSPDSDKPSSSSSYKVDSPPTTISRKMSYAYTVLPITNIITQMMATPESLLVHSLIKHNPSQAGEVIKLFRLTEKTAETCEVTFVDIYRASASKIWDLETESRESSQTPPKVGKRSVKALSKAAAVGVATASLSNIVDDLLGKSCVPPVPRPKTAYAKENFSYLFNIDSSSILLMDLLCTSCRTWETCSNMLDIIKTKTKLLEHDPRHVESITLSTSCHSDSSSVSNQRSITQSPSSSSSSVTSPPMSSTARPKNLKSALQGIVGCSEFLWCLYDLIHVGDSDSLLQVYHSPSAAKVGLQHHFHSAHSSLHTDSLRSIERAIIELRKAVDRVQQVLPGGSQGNRMDISIEDPIPSPSPSPRGSLSGSLSGSMTGSTSSVSRTGTKQPSDQSPLHLAIKQLMHVMEKCVPGEGLTHLHVGSGKVTSPPVKNYLLSLYEHVKEMAYLVAECEGKNKELTHNYFKVLEDGPVNVLGRLMFVKKMPPARLEAVAEKLNLNLTDTIVFSCCPKIPSKHPPVLPDLENVTKKFGTKVYNLQHKRISIEEVKDMTVESQPSAEVQTEKPLHPEVIVRTVLTNLVNLMEDLSTRQNAKEVFDLTCAKNLVQISEYHDILGKVKDLLNADLTLLESEEERLCFFINLTNLMIMHCHLSQIQSRLEALNQNDELGTVSQDEKIGLYPLAAADFMAYFSTFSYSVGQLGIVSVFDLLTMLSCNGMASSSQWQKIMACRTLVLSPEDPWKQFIPSPEPRLIFAINAGCTSSPPLQILKPDTVSNQLEKAMKDYLSHSITVSVEQERVSIPELLLWHERDFVQDLETHKETNHAALVKWVSDYMNAEKQSQLQQLFNLDSVHGYSENIDTSGRNELPFHIDVASFDNTFSVNFEIATVKVSHVSVQSSVTHAKKDKPPAYRDMSSFEKSGQGWNLELPVYNLTPVTLEYVKQDSLLVATMVSLVCADNLDNIEQQFTDDHFNMPESGSHSSSIGGMYQDSLLRSQRSSSDISLVDIRSYRYHRLTDDYPVLQRHLLHYILPLAGADNPELFESREPILKFVTNDIDNQVKLCMFSLPHSSQFQYVIQDMANRLLEEHKWLEILNILRCLPDSVIEERMSLQALHDFVLSCWSISEVKKPGQAPKVGDGLRKFYNPGLQARIVLTICDSLPLDLAIDLFDVCLTSLEEHSGLWKAVNVRYQEFQVFSKVMVCVKSLLIKISMRDIPIFLMSLEDQQLNRILEDFTDWHQIPEASRKRPSEVLTVLDKAGDFVTAKTWAQLFHVPQDLVKEIEERHLLHLLTLEQPDTVKAFQLLDDLRKSSETDCLVVCQSLAKHLTSPREIKFVIGFVLEYLTSQLIPEDVEDLRLRRIGSKALMNIPSNIQGEYSHLISCPHLILEQLLMNMKAELAGQIFEQIKLDFIEIKEPKLRVAQDQFNSLLATYANKAIEVTVANVRVLSDNSRSDSANSSEAGHYEDGDFASNVMKGQHSGDRRKTDLSASPTPSTASSMTPRQETPGRMTSRRESTLGLEGKRFIMPAQPPSQDQWVPDYATSVCMVCKIERFSMFNRRHHCRRCGRVVCGACSTKQTMILNVLSRTCDECYEQIHSTSDHRAQEEHEIYSQRIKERLSGANSSPKLGYATSPNTPVHSSILGPDRLKSSMASAIHHADHSWKLRPDTTYSDHVRSEFYYEQAPSVSLCSSILKQHSSRFEAGKLILSLCDTLSTHLVPISPGVPNPEIDYSLIISIMRQLLFQAKLDSLHANTGMIDQCDMYLGRVDLLKVMVEANYQDLPTIKELTKHDSVRRLRDKLIADERLSLAMEVSTKCGIDPAGVWSAMGFSCLNVGDFHGARDKFSHCLKVPTDKNQASAGQNRLMGEILDFLDKIPSSGVTEVQRLLSDPASICDIKTLLVPSVGEENRIESIPYKECLYYLRTYGSYMDHISFLRQHGYWMKAVQFAADHHCSSDVFVNGLMVPSMTSGELGRLLDQMLMLDPTLEKWISYLTATCKYLLKQKHMNSLYFVQLFMKDFVRAAMTCIGHFYQKGATSYLDLSGRLQYLFTAQQHLQAYLDPGQWGSVRHPLAPHTPSPTSTHQGPHWEKSPESDPRMTMTTEQIKKNIRTIALQIEVTKFLEQCLTQAMGGASAMASSFSPRPGSKLPTLFGEGPARTELVSLILLSGIDFRAGFDLAVRIVRECRLNPTIIFTHCSRELAKMNRFSEISSLTESLIQQGLVDDNGIDEIVGASLLIIADSHNQARDESDSLIQLLRNDSNKINALILCGKLRSAYLLAVKRDRVEDVQRISGAAQRLGQSAVKNICKKWLEQHQK